MFGRFCTYVEKESLFVGGGRFLLAVSGGVDSAVLLDLMRQYSQTYAGVSLGIAHCNFHLRGEESDRDEKFVRGLAQSYGFPLFTVSFDTVSYAKRHSISIEMAARELRYGYFSRLMRQEGFGACLLAHHADDNAETFFINLFRGSGVRGLRGMLPRSGREDVYLRPLLFARRPEIVRYARERGLDYVEDSTNAQEVYLRNRIRHSVLPMLEDCSPGFVGKLGQTMQSLRAVDSLVSEWYAEVFSRLVQRMAVTGNGGEWFRKYMPKGYSVSGQEFFSSDSLATLGNRAGLFWELYLRERSFSRQQIDQVLANRTGGIPGKVFVNTDGTGVLLREPGGWRWVAFSDGPEQSGLIDGKEADVSAGFAVVSDIDCGESEPCWRNLLPEREHPDTERVGGGSLSEMFSGFGEGYQDTERVDVGPVFEQEMQTVVSLQEVDPNPDTVYLAYEKLQFPLYWRRWQPGDRFRPLGMKGFKKLSDFFTDLRLGVARKEKVWLLCSGNDIVWVAGYRLDDRYKLDFSAPGSKKAWVVRLLEK